LRGLLICVIIFFFFVWFCVGGGGGGAPLLYLSFKPTNTTQNFLSNICNKIFLKKYNTFLGFVGSMLQCYHGCNKNRKIAPSCDSYLDAIKLDDTDRQIDLPTDRRTLSHIGLLSLLENSYVVNQATLAFYTKKKLLCIESSRFSLLTQNLLKM